MAYFVVDNITNKAFTLTLADLEHPFTTDYYICFYLKVDGEIVVNTPAFDFSTDATTVTFSYGFSDSGTLVSGESYDISVTVVTKDGNYWNIPTQSGELYETIAIPYPEEIRPDKAVYDFCKVVYVGNKRLKAYVDFSAIDAAGYRLDNVYVDTALTPDVGHWELTRSSPEAYFYNLSDGMTYTFNLYAYYNDNLPIDNGVEVSKAVERKISLFNWTDEELYALENHGEIATITRSRWNELCEYARKTVGYWGIADNVIRANSYGLNENTTLSWAIAKNTKMASSDKKLYAKKFNILNYCICQEIGTGITDRAGITDVESGTADKADKVLGEYFITLVDRLNYK